MPAYTALVERNGETFRAVIIHRSADPAKAAAYARWVWWDAENITLEANSHGYRTEEKKTARVEGQGQ